MTDKKDIEKISKVFESKTNLSKSQVKELLVQNGYSESTITEVLKALEAKKKMSNNTNITDKEIQANKQKILAELSKTVIVKKESMSPKKRTNPFIKFYYLLEDNYYSFLDKVNKVIPIYKITDPIDKVFPSFILSIILLLGILGGFYFLFTSGVLATSSESSLSVYVVDEQDFPLVDVNVSYITDKLSENKLTDVFGISEFTSIKSKKVNIVVSKENYKDINKEIQLNSKIQEEKVILKIDPSKFEYPETPERRREIIFKSFDVVIIDNLNVTFKCTNTAVLSQPKTTNVTTGRTSVIQTKNCGKLLITVNSNNYELVTEREIPENNVIELTKINSNTGVLEVVIKDSRGQAIQSVNVKAQVIDNPLTAMNESDQTVDTGTTDLYGKYKFNLSAGNYLISADKLGYISLPKQGPFVVVNNNITSANITLFTAQDLENINCSNSAFAQFCINGRLDCNSPLLVGLTIPNPNGTGCVVGKISNLTIKLKDQNTSVLVKGDISVYRRDANVSSLVNTRSDVNQTTFILLANKNYRVVVSGTEDLGYLSPDSIDINNLADINKLIEIPLTYSSALNSGKISVNVKKDGYNRANALVYLYYKQGDDYILYNPESPSLTNLNGDVNFLNVRSNRKYYAYSILRYENADGDSLPEVKLDNNSLLELDIDLENQSKILNIKITPNQDYNIVAYTQNGEEIDSEEYIITGNSTDVNKTIIFSCSNNRIYLKIIKNDIIYQTDLISLVPGQTTFKEITFPASIVNIQTSTEFLGLYDETGSTRITNIGFSGENDIRKEYKLKFKSVFGSESQNVLKKSQIRAGQFLTTNDDYIFISNNNLFVPEDVEISSGCKYRGDLIDWNAIYFNAYYQNDLSRANCPTDKYKWIEFDFSGIESSIIEYSVNIRFKNEVTNPNYYKINYKSINGNLQTFAFNPTLSNWQSWSIQPEGFFYANSELRPIPFSSIDYSYSLVLADVNGPLTKFGSDYILYTNRNYNYDFNFTYFSDQNKTGDIIDTQENTNGNYKFRNFSFKDTNSNLFQVLDNNTTITIPQKTTRRAYSFIFNTIGTPVNFFSLTGTPKIVTRLFKNNQNTLETINTNVLSYSDSNYNIEIISNSSDGNIYIGVNDLNISIKNAVGVPQNNIPVKYRIGTENSVIQLGQTNEAQGNQLNTQIFIPDNFSGQTITFIFTMTGLNIPNNELSKSLTIGYGIDIFDLEGKLITSNNRLIFNNTILDVNGIESTSLVTNNYIIKKRTNSIVSIEEISVADNNYLETEIINSNLVSENNLPKGILGENTEVITSVLIDSNAPAGPIDFQYNNIFKIQNSLDNTTITIYRDTNSLVLVQKVTITDHSKFENTPEGYYSDSNGGNNLELITDLSESKTLDYNLDLLFETRDANYNLLDITIAGEDINNIVEFNYTENVVSGGNKLSGLVTFNFNLANNYSGTEIISKNITVNLKVGNSISNFIYAIPLNIKIYPRDSVFSIGTGIYGNGMGVNCHSNIWCNSAKIYNLKNNTKGYKLYLEEINLQDPFPTSFSVNTIPVLVSPDSNQDVIIFIDGNYTNLIDSNQSSLNYNKNIIFDLNINNNLFEVPRDLTIVVSYISEDPAITVSEIGMTNTFCLGVGGQISLPDYYILGKCGSSTSSDVCKTGVEALPKIVYAWEDSELPSGKSWVNLCIDNSLNYNADMIHCDSVQMLYSIFSLISSNDNYSDQNNYIYLMADGVSEDLLNDFRLKYNTFQNAPLIDGDFRTAYLDNDSEKSIALSKVDASNESTISVGKYQIIVENYDPNVPSDFTIKLKLIRLIPVNNNNLFYSIPIDGDFGKQANGTVHRIGYGSSIVGDYNYNELIDVALLGTSTVKLYKATTNCEERDCSGVVNITASHPTSYDIGWQVSDVLDSDGTLFDLEIDKITNNKINLRLNFTPSLPVNIFAKVSGIQDQNFNYILKSQNTQILSWPSFIKWKDQSDFNYVNTITDNAIYGPHSIYLRHTITKPQFVSKYGSNLNPNYLLESLIYLPVNPQINLGLLTLSLDGLDNNSGSRLYDLNSTTGVTNLQMHSSVSKVISLQDALDQVENGNACLNTELFGAYIKWEEDKIKVSSNVKNQIIQSYNGN